MKKITSPIKAIRAYCLDCSNDQPREITLCPCESCALWPFRAGKNPFRTVRKLTDAQRATRASQLAEARKNVVSAQ